jgi:protein kinase C substrate 80K-H
VLAEERAARAKAEKNYIIGSKLRRESISQYQNWRMETMDKLRQLRDVDLKLAEKEQQKVDQELTQAKVSLAKNWLQVINDEVLVSEPLMDIVRGMSLDDLASFILSLCWLSAEASPGNVANDRCVAFDRASLDLGILWNYSDSDGSTDNTLPTFTYIDSKAETALVEFSDKIMLRLEGKDTKKENSSSSSHHPRHKKNKRESPPDSGDSSSDDPYGDDYEDYHDYDHYDDDYVGEDDHKEEPDESNTEGEEADVVKEESPTPSSYELLVKSLFDMVPLGRNRNLFREQSNVLLKYKLPEAPPTDDEASGEEESSTDGGENADDEDDAGDDSSTASDGVDPMAIQMAKSTINKRLSSITRGETSAKSAATFVASVFGNSSALRKDSPTLKYLRKMAIMTLYHSKIATEDVAELIYSVSSNLRSTEPSGQNEEEESSCSASWSTMCPPRTIQSGQKSYPPPLIFDAARKRCEQRESSQIGSCAVVQEGEEIEFPSEIPDGYYNYYEPQTRSSDDGINSYFSRVNSLHLVPENLMNLRKQKLDADKKKNSLAKEVADLERDTAPKYGVDGELYSMRDTCHTVESGKYEYEVCIFGKATQRDIGQKSGGTNLGSWKEMVVEDGRQTLKWDGGLKCWNGPVRSADVYVTCGAETKLLTADEPETCKYAFTMESPLACVTPP